MVRVTSTKLCTIQNAGLVVGIFMLDVRVLIGGIIVLHKKLLKELESQGRLCNTSIANHYQFVLEEMYDQGRLCNTSIANHHQCLLEGLYGQGRLCNTSIASNHQFSSTISSWKNWMIRAYTFKHLHHQPPPVLCTSISQQSTP
uniref:Uncharacterized protein LOC111112222 isoform X2 n=1 Tax=Crassostrea virginica TaxID=6565 RepID=A0A8B8BPV2_CRAVI|nr:uncharacterized protein LOC111112222 isoform X2 [Crassostrea virginica]